MLSLSAHSLAQSFRHRLLELYRACLICVLSPLPAMLLWRSHEGRCVALWCFCASCFAMVAYAFRPRLLPDRPVPSWLRCILSLGGLLFSAWVVFSLLWILVVDPQDFVALFAGFQILIPSLCLVPFLTLITRKPFAAVVFAAFLLACMKMIAGVVVNSVYGWGDGHHEMPWTAPNLMLLTFWVASTILCLTCYRLGARRFRSETVARLCAAEGAA